MKNFQDVIEREISESVRVKQRLLCEGILPARIAEVAERMVAVFRAGGKVLWAGNGGSAADAQHLAAELVNKFRMDRPGLPSVALTTDSSVLTSIGNDYGYPEVFARQIDALGAPGDLFIGISTSGESENLVRALEACRRKGLHAVALVGEKSCRMDAYDTVLHIPSAETPSIQECHTLIGHILCGLVESELFG